jgi:hypothetical protein
VDVEQNIFFELAYEINQKNLDLYKVLLGNNNLYRLNYPFSSSIFFYLKKLIRFPVFLVNCFNPLGHSGQPKLQAVVGSILNASGIPDICEDFKVLETKKLEYSLKKFKVFLIEKNLINAKISFLFIR